jgi:ATP-dependent DNA helicase RecG
MATTEEWQRLTQVQFDNKTESNNIDFKRDLAEDNERLKEHINAFGNSPTGGLFVFGVNKDYSFYEEAINQDTITERIATVAHDAQVPSLGTVVHHITLNSKILLGIEVLPGSQLPVFIKSRDPWTKGAFKRSGSSTLPMTEQEIRSLMARSQQFSYDFEPVLDAKVEDLDTSSLEEHIPTYKASQGGSLGNIQVLLDNQIIRAYGNGYLPTLAGWLMFANNPQKIRSLRNASIEFQLFKDKTRSEQVRVLPIYGTLPQQVSLAIDTLLQHVWKIPKLQGIKREEIASYDKVTLREVITNAVVHRDYQQLHQPVKIAMFSDRIEVENPGGLLPGLTTFNLLHKRAWRNEGIAELMTKVGLGEMDGQGIDRIYAATNKLKVPAPTLYDENRSFKIVLSAPKEYDDYTPSEKRLTVLVLLILEQEVDNEGIRNVFNIDAARASTLLKLLVDDDMIRRTGPSMKFARYRLTEEFQRKVWG